jgi:Flp pilus assembly pilin Flp
MSQQLNRLRKILRDTTAQDVVEYALLAGFVALALTAAFPAVSKPWARLARKVLKISGLAAGVSSSFNC